MPHRKIHTNELQCRTLRVSYQLSALRGLLVIGPGQELGSRELGVGSRNTEILKLDRLSGRFAGYSLPSGP